MDRVFYGRRKLFQNKLAATVVSCRRGGASSTFEQINKYFSTHLKIGFVAMYIKGKINNKFI